MRSLQTSHAAFAGVLFLLALGADAARASSALVPWGPMNEIEAAAKREGKLVVYASGGHMNAEAQQAISLHFKEKYGIGIEWTALDARDQAPRLLAEQRTKQYTTDLSMAGFGSVHAALQPRGYLLPIMAPSTFEKGVWRLDPAAARPRDRDWLFIFMALNPSFFVNTNLVPAGEEPKAYQDLLNPKWKGKIVIQDPATPGAGSGWFTATYKKLGLEYMKALAKQLVLVRGVNDSADAVARGTHPIAVSPSNARSRQLVKQGAPVKFTHPREGSHLANQGVYFIANAPHPNAGKLFLHWFFTREGQTMYASNYQVPALRKDVPQDFLAPELRYIEGQPFLMADVDDLTAERTQELRVLTRQIFGQVQ